MRPKFFNKCDHRIGMQSIDNWARKELRMISAVHYRSLRIAVRDDKRQILRTTFDGIVLTRPTIRAKYCTSSINIKAMTKKGAL